jgi:hypothetical protein
MGLIADKIRGAAAGAAGTVAMDLLWYYRYRRGGGTHGFWDWETAAGLEGYDTSSAPAQVGRKLFHALTGEDPPASSARLATNIMHWYTGIGWAAVYGLRQPHSPRPALTAAAFGPVVWASSYAMLPAMGIYKPIWKYDAKTLWQDFGAHLTYGSTTTVVYAMLSR